MARERVGESAIRDLGLDLLGALIKGEISEREVVQVWSKENKGGPGTARKYRNRFRQVLGQQDPIVKSIDSLVEKERRRRISLNTTISWLSGTRPEDVPQPVRDKISEAQRRSHASGKRKPLSPDHGTRVSLGKKRTRDKDK